jgi:hypothetical protein
MKKILVIISIFGVQLCLAYDNVKAHREFNRAIVEKFLSRAVNIETFADYSFGSLDISGLKGPAVTASGWNSATTADREYTARGWIIEGGYSADEPEIPAAFRHFYDPLAVQGGKYYLTDLKTDIVNPAIDAIYWHFTGTDALSGSNPWTWEAGKKHLCDALSTIDEQTRDGLCAKAFRCLGEVLHNTADMGCPPHVRNDAHGGYPGVGGSDPYESGFNSSWVAEYGSGACDPSLSASFAAATSAQAINKTLAGFTNKYFLSYETVSGTGVQPFTSANGMTDYPSPKLEKLTYDPITFNYTYVFASGREVIMCNDRSLFMGYISQNFRASPRMTTEAVKSQATELVPDIVAAGVNVMKLFFPRLQVSLTTDLRNKKLEGTIEHTATGEYPNAIAYSGKIGFFINGKLTNVTDTVQSGSFSLTTSAFKANDKIVAFINFAGITVKSKEVIVTDNTTSQDTTIDLMPIAVTTDPQATFDGWQGPSTQMTIDFEAKFRAPAGTEYTVYEYATTADRKIYVNCKNEKPIEVTFSELIDEISPQTWIWSIYNDSLRDTVRATFTFDSTESVVHDLGTGNINPPNVVTTKAGSFYEYSFVFDPPKFFTGICSTFRLELTPVISCSVPQYWGHKDSTGRILATERTAAYYDISFWKDY